MRFLDRNNWLDVPLDYFTLDSEVSLNVIFMINVVSASDAYFKRPGSIRMVFNYIKDIGLKATLIKVTSRLNERRRNAKFLSIGIGFMDTLNERKLFLFIAPLHPECVEIICVDKKLTKEIFTDFSFDFNKIGHTSTKGLIPHHLSQLCELHGWSSYSGEKLPDIDWDPVDRHVFESIKADSIDKYTYRDNSRNIVTTSTLNEAPIKSVENKICFTATLLGYGNYAKTVIIPSLPSGINVTRIHEVDPLQISPEAYQRFTCDSSPFINNLDPNNIFFIAGFHHTHATLAIEALSRNSVAVVEKPLVTTKAQLDALLPALQISQGRYFACFNKRYLGFNDLVRSDMGIGKADPINYHAIVYEVPLPARHWYRWPNSGSRVLSNGCHWLDHFLFLNSYCKVDHYDLFQCPDGTTNVTVVLENAACMTMTLTDIGSERLGVQDYVELRQNGTTIRIINNSSYEAENADRIVRKVNRNRMDCFRNMYQSIGEAIIQGRPGDTRASIEIGSQLILGLEEILTRT